MIPAEGETEVMHIGMKQAHEVKCSICVRKKSHIRKIFWGLMEKKKEEIGITVRHFLLLYLKVSVQIYSEFRDVQRLCHRSNHRPSGTMPIFVKTFNLISFSFSRSSALSIAPSG